jgi:hypothetical protein
VEDQIEKHAKDEKDPKEYFLSLPSHFSLPLLLLL